MSSEFINSLDSLPRHLSLGAGNKRKENKKKERKITLKSYPLSVFPSVVEDLEELEGKTLNTTLNCGTGQKPKQKFLLPLYPSLCKGQVK